MLLDTTRARLRSLSRSEHQKRFRETAQSRADSSQLWNRFSCTKEGTQYVFLLFARSFSLRLSTLMKVPGTAL